MQDLKNKRPITGRPITSFPKAKSKESHEKSSSSSSSSSLNDLSESNNSISSREKIDFLEGLSKGKQKAAFENLIKEEADRIDMINKQKKKLKNINLLENEIEGLYDWKTLFNHSRPISSYTKISKKTKKIEETKNDDFKFPVVLVDLPENEFKHYLQTTETPIPNKEKDKKKEKKEKNLEKNKINEKKEKKRPQTSIKRNLTSIDNSQNEKKIKKKGNCVRPMSVYSQRDQDDIFYFSQTFSDYYKEDLKTFSQKMPILKAKIKQDPSRLKSAIKKAHKQTKIREEELNKILISDDLLLNRQEVIIAGKGGNAMPLLKSIYEQIHADQPIENHKDIKYYYNTMKPLGNKVFVDYTKNDRSKHIREYIKLRDGNKNENNEKNDKNNFDNKNEIKSLHLSTYNTNDPDLLIFNKIKEENEDIEGEDNKNHNIELNIGQKEEIELKPNEIITEETNLSTQKNLKKNLPNIETNNIYVKTQNSISQRPKTGIIKVNNINQTNRPLTTANICSHRMLSASNGSTIYTETQFSDDANFIPQKIFPLRPPSSQVNVTFNKINQRIQRNKHSFSKENLFFDEEGQIKFNYNHSQQNLSRPKTAVYKNNNIKNKLNEVSKGINTMSKWEMDSNKDGRNQFVSYYDFNRYIDTVFSDEKPYLKIHKEEKNYYYPMHCFNKMAGKYYSCSNNAHVKAKRTKKKEIIDNIEFDEGNNFYNNQKRRMYSAK